MALLSRYSLRHTARAAWLRPSQSVPYLSLSPFPSPSPIPDVLADLPLFRCFGSTLCLGASFALLHSNTPWIPLFVTRIMITSHSERGREYGNSHSITASPSSSTRSTRSPAPSPKGLGARGLTLFSVLALGADSSGVRLPFVLCIARIFPSPRC